MMRLFAILESYRCPPCPQRWDFSDALPGETRRAGRGAIPPLVLLLAIGLTTPAFAQSFLGTIRGTVVDPQGQVVPGAAVLITDESTGVPRSLETDAQGRYEAPNVRPGTYR